MDLIFILYKPAVPRNVGAAARAIKTMGFTELRLIAPCNHLSKEARMLAHGSNDILENAKVFSDFKECTRDIDLLIGTTAKKRSSKEDYKEPIEIKEILSSKAQSIKNAGIIFGTEESGLPNEILQKCDLASSIPLKTSHPSLNLGQSVMLYAYELSDIEIPLSREEKPNMQSYQELKSRIKRLLPELGIPENMPLYSRILERLSLLSSSDINLLHSVSSRLKIGNTEKKVSGTGNKTTKKDS